MPKREFSIKTDSEEFNSRSRNVFDGLETRSGSSTFSATRDSAISENIRRDSPKRSRSNYRESDRERNVFRKPSTPSLPRNFSKSYSSRPSIRGIPGHVSQPEKWTKYSLEETGEERCKTQGDALNKNIALNFIQELRKGKEVNPKVQESNAIKDGAPPIFRKPQIKGDQSESSIGKSDSGGESSAGGPGAVHKMPEYVVGKKTGPKFKKIARETASVAGEVSSSSSINRPVLDHLQLEESEDSEQNVEKKKTVSQFHNINARVLKKRKLRERSDDA